MKRIALVTLAALASLALLLSGTAAAGCSLCVQKVTAETRDGAAWQPGQPVVLVFDVNGQDLPERGLAVVMEIDKEKTKCLEVELRRVSGDASSGRYAGIFYPFHEGEFDGKVMFGASAPQDFGFRVDRALAPASVSADAELPSADPLAAAPPSLLDAARASLPAALLALLLALLPVLLLRPRRAEAS